MKRTAATRSGRCWIPQKPDRVAAVRFIKKPRYLASSSTSISASVLVACAMTSNPDRSLAERSQRIKNEAQRLGFELVGISPVRVPPHEEPFAQWLRQKLHGHLDYMARTELLRRDPR